LTSEQRAQALIEATEPLLDLFATMDAVFTEDDAMTEHARTSLGRCYEAWKRARAALDDDWNPDARPRRTMVVDSTPPWD
jgi:hypothetical protein